MFGEVSVLHVAVHFGGVDANTLLVFDACDREVIEVLELRSFHVGSEVFQAHAGLEASGGSVVGGLRVAGERLQKRACFGLSDGTF